MTVRDIVKVGAQAEIGVGLSSASVVLHMIKICNRGWFVNKNSEDHHPPISPFHSFYSLPPLPPLPPLLWSRGPGCLLYCRQVLVFCKKTIWFVVKAFIARIISKLMWLSWNDEPFDKNKIIPFHIFPSPLPALPPIPLITSPPYTIVLPTLLLPLFFPTHLPPRFFLSSPSLKRGISGKMFEILQWGWWTASLYALSFDRWWKADDERQCWVSYR